MMIKLGLKKSSDREEKRHERIIDKNLQRLNIQKLNLSNLVSLAKIYLNKNRISFERIKNKFNNLSKAQSMKILWWTKKD